MPVSNIFLREASREDSEKIAILEKKVFRRPWSRHSIDESMRKNEYILLCAYEDDSLVGYIIILLLYDIVHISRIAVEESFRGRGIGSLLLDRGIEMSTERFSSSVFTLEVRVSNKSAISLYKKRGFVELGVRKHYYEDNREDALIMNLEV